MLPVELDGKTPWPKHKADFKLKEIYKQASEELRARDESFGVGTSCLVEVTLDGGQKQHRIDPVKSAMKHSGQEHTDIVNLRWWEFCQSPQDSSVIDAPKCPRPIPLDPRTINGFAPMGPRVIQPESLADPIPMKKTAVPKKRGRPAKERFEMSPPSAELVDA